MYKKYLLFMLLLVIISSLSGKISIISSNERSLVLEYELDEFDFNELTYSGQEYIQINSNGSGSLAPGSPDLPTSAAWIAIPRGTEATVKYRSEDVRYFNPDRIAPVPQPQAEMKGAAGLQFIENEEIYNKNSYYPQLQAGLEKESFYRGQPCSVIRFFPFQYNAVSDELAVHYRIVAEISFQGRAEALPEQLTFSGMKNHLAGFTLNGAEIFAYEQSLSGDRENWRDAGCDMLIFCPEEFRDAANTLKNWKERKGIETKVVSTEITGGTSFGIAAYIDDYCETHDPAPQYILLFGDAEFIPPWYVHQDPYDGMMLGTDVYYADLEMEFDFLLDFSLGRIPVDTVEDAERVVDNIINYELNPPEDGTFYSNAVIAGAFQDGSGGDPPDTYANRRFAKTSEDIRNYLDEENYTPQRIYAEYNGYSNAPIYPTYWNQNYYIFENDIPGGELPEELQKPQFPWNAVEGDVSAALNAGSFLLSHRDHGGRGGWGEPDFNSNSVLNLTNGNELPVVWSVNCLTGYFDNETDEAGAGTGENSECFVEYWFRNPNGGAAGVVGSTRVSYSGNNDRFVWGLMDGIWPGFLDWCGADYPTNYATYRMGEVVNYAKTYLSLNYFSEDILLITFEEFEWFGDPTMEIWVQQPEQMEITYTDNVEYGSDIIIDAGMTGAVCTLWNGEEVIATGQSGLNHEAVLAPEYYAYTEELLLTVSYAQYQPYTGIINIEPPAEGYLSLENIVLNDESGNDNGNADYGETLQIGIELENIGLETIDGFTLQLDCSSEFVEVNNNSYTYTEVLEWQESVILEDIFEISIADNCPNGEIAVLQISGAGFEFNREIRLNAPVFAAGYFQVIDENGNNNGAADAGETINLQLPVINCGSALAEEVNVLLLSYSPAIILTEMEVFLDSLGKDEIEVEFEATVSASATAGEEYQLHIFINSGDYSFDRIMSGNIGMAIEDFESADFELFDWEINGTTGWMIDEDAASGDYSARTMLMGVNNWTELSISGFLEEPGIIGFYRKLYADTSLPDNNGGILYFMVDDTEVASWGGNAPWQFFEFEIADGPHTFRWIFEKDLDPTLGYDGAWIDRIEFPSMVPAPEAEMYIETEEINMTLESGEEGESELLLTNVGAGTIEYQIYFADEGRSLGDSYLSINTHQYYPGQNTGWLLQLVNSSLSDEGISDLSLSFPEELTVNVSTPLTGGSGGQMQSNGNTGAGITINWHGEAGGGFLQPGETAQGAVNVTVAENAPLSLTLQAVIAGDEGSVIEQDIILGNLSNGWLTLSNNHGWLVYGEYENIAVDFNAEGLQPGLYSQDLIISDGLGNLFTVPVNLEVTATSANNNEVAKRTELTAVNPNPFNPETMIHFQLQQEENVNISVYNIKGQRVSVLIDEVMKAGKHQIIWSAEQQPSGVYFIRLKSTMSRDTQKVLLLK